MSFNCLFPSSMIGLLSLLLLHFSSAFSSGPGGCAGGMPATVGHRTPDPIPTFAQQGYDLLINGQVVTDPSTVSLMVDSSYEFTVRATGTPFLGALIRVDGIGMLEAGQNSALASACTTVPGVGHTNNTPKTMLSGMYDIMGGTSVTLDITVVETNQAESIYSYQQFQLAVAAPVTQAPVGAPPSPAPTALADRSSSFFESVAAFFGLLRSIFASLAM